jgi:carboxypeptidase PM20D1
MMKIFRRALVVLAVGLVGLVAVLLIRTAQFSSRRDSGPVAAGAPLDVDLDRVAGHLAGAIRFATVSRAGAGAAELQPFLDLHEYLRSTFPLAAERLRWEPIKPASLLITWEGTDPALEPLLLAAHLDVVPAVGGETATDEDASWRERAFRGDDDGTYLWGRGTLDDKASVLGILEATEALLKGGHAPRRTILLAFGADEEIGGRDGARAIAAELLARDRRLACVLDEGSEVLVGIVPGLSAPVAAVGIAEKGYLDMALSVEAEGGHSSIPPANTAIGILGRAIARLEDHPMPARLDGVAWRTLEMLGPELPFAPRLALANRWLFGPLITRQLGASTAMNSSIRTTLAVTLIRGGTKDNVLPRAATAIANVRVLPGDTGRGVLDHVRRAVADPRVKVAFADSRVYPEVLEASRVSPVDSAAFAAIRRAIRQTFPDVLIVPSLVTAGTDARNYERLTDRIYRFLPIRLGPDDLGRFHGVGERIRREDYAEAIRFYYRFIKEFD